MANPPRAEEDLVDQLLQDWRRERPDLNAAPMAIVGRILRMGRLLEAQADACLKDSGISYRELDLLATLRRTGKPYRLAPTELRKSVLLTSGAMTACLNRLEQRGLIVRVADETDGRSLLAMLSVKGLRLIDRAIALRFDQAKAATAGLSEGEQAKLARLLRKLQIG